MNEAPTEYYTEVRFIHEHQYSVKSEETVPLLIINIDRNKPPNIE